MVIQNQNAGRGSRGSESNPADASIGSPTQGKLHRRLQELLRHASSRIILDTYAQAVGDTKRKAQRQVYQMLRDKGVKSEVLPSVTMSGPAVAAKSLKEMVGHEETPTPDLYRVK